jgi:hypothetical protein
MAYTWGAYIWGAYTWTTFWVSGNQVFILNYKHENKQKLITHVQINKHLHVKLLSQYLQ